jgi:uncharacterized repeat protein (TIGR01451 family)
MSIAPRPHRSGLVRLLVIIVAVVAPTTATSWAGAQTEPAAQLSIAIDDGRTSADVDDELTYTVTVRNIGTAEVTDLQVTQTIPPGLRFDSADGDGVPEEGAVRWVVDLAAEGEAVLHSTMTVTEPSDDVLRLATVACATTGPTEPPIVCATDSDQLPAGASAAAAADPDDADDDGSSTGAVAAIVGGIVLVLAALVLVLRRRRRL